MACENSSPASPPQSTRSSPSIATPSQACPFPRPHHSCPDAYLTFRAGSQPPSLLVTVSGIVTHGKGPAANPANTPRSAVDGHPRVFSQTFMLAPDPNAPPTKSGEVAKYYITADALRFVG